MDISGYLDQVRGKYASGQATEHSYRPALPSLFESIDPALTVINEPKKSDAGMPDFLFQRGTIPLGWCEAKDIDKDVIKLKGYSIEQSKRDGAIPNMVRYGVSLFDWYGRSSFPSLSGTMIEHEAGVWPK